MSIQSTIREPLSDRAQRILDLAAAEASQRGEPIAQSVDVLLSVFDDGGGVAVAILQHLGVPLGTLTAILRERIEAASGERPSPATIAPSAPPTELLRAAAGAAHALGHRYVGTEHLLIASIQRPGFAADVLAQWGVTSEVASVTAAHLLGKQIV